MTIKKISFFLGALAFVAVFTACGSDNTPDNESKGRLSIKITDSPIDDAEVSGTFVTVSDVKVDGKSIEGFNKTTIDVLAYQNGETKLLTNSELEAAAYSDITFVLDFDTDVNGNSPGCYVLEQSGNKKHKLTSSTNEVKLTHAVTIVNDVTTELVVDFDLRKCIKREDNTEDKYDFVTKSEMESGIRVVTSGETGVVKGNCDDMISNSDKVVVYAYKKGEYDRDTEVQGQGESKLQFRNAVTSSALTANGDYELHFLEEGEYELHFCSYEEDANGNMQLKGTLQVNVLGTLNIGAINVESSSTVNLDILVTGILLI